MNLHLFQSYQPNNAQITSPDDPYLWTYDPNILSSIFSKEFDPSDPYTNYFNNHQQQHQQQHVEVFHDNNKTVFDVPHDEEQEKGPSFSLDTLYQEEDVPPLPSKNTTKEFDSYQAPSPMPLSSEVTESSMKQIEHTKQKQDREQQVEKKNPRFINDSKDRNSVDMPYVSEAEKPILARPEHNCANCHTPHTPMWRRIEGHFYCNKCALYYYRTNKHRPLNMGTNKNSKRRRRANIAESDSYHEIKSSHKRKRKCNSNDNVKRSKKTKGSDKVEIVEGSTPLRSDFEPVQSDGNNAIAVDFDTVLISLDEPSNFEFSMTMSSPSTQSCDSSSSLFNDETTLISEPVSTEWLFSQVQKEAQTRPGVQHPAHLVTLLDLLLQK